MVSVAWIGLAQTSATETGPLTLLGSLWTFVVQDDLFPQESEALQEHSLPL